MQRNKYNHDFFSLLFIRETAVLHNKQAVSRTLVCQCIVLVNICDKRQKSQCWLMWLTANRKCDYKEHTYREQYVSIRYRYTPKW